MTRKRLTPINNAWNRWSYSKLGCALGCPLHCFFGYMLKIPSKQNPWAVYGQAIHYIFQQFFTPHKSTKRYPYQTVEKLQGAWAHFWITAAKGEHKFSSREKGKEEVNWSYPAQKEVMIGMGKKVMRVFFEKYHELRFDDIPRFNERRFTVPIGRLTLSGIIDRIDINPNGATVLDYKAGSYPDYLSASGIQLTFYQIAYDQYFKHTIGNYIPLKGVEIYSYNQGRIQEAPLRTNHEINMLLDYLLEASEYFRYMLNDTEVDRDIIGSFKYFNEEDIKKQDISPILPRDSQCQYCPYIKACRKWELNSHPPARELWLKKRDEDRENIYPSQEIITFPPSEPIQPRMNYTPKIHHKHNVEQLTLDI